MSHPQTHPQVSWELIQFPFFHILLSVDLCSMNCLIPRVKDIYLYFDTGIIACCMSVHVLSSMSFPFSCWLLQRLSKSWEAPPSDGKDTWKVPVHLHLYKVVLCQEPCLHQGRDGAVMTQSALLLFYNQGGFFSDYRFLRECHITDELQAEQNRSLHICLRVTQLLFTVHGAEMKWARRKWFTPLW